MMAAAAMGATAFQKGLGGIHALSHPVGALYDTHHGLTNAVFVPYVLAFNRKAIEDKVKRLAAYIGLRPSFRAFMDFVLELREQTGIPHTLAGLKVDDAKVDTIVKMAPEDPTAGGNPVKLDKRAARTIFMRALEGRLYSTPATPASARRSRRRSARCRRAAARVGLAEQLDAEQRGADRADAGPDRVGRAERQRLQREPEQQEAHDHADDCQHRGNEPREAFGVFQADGPADFREPGEEQMIHAMRRLL